MRLSLLGLSLLASLAGCLPGINSDNSDSPSNPRNLTINWHFKGLNGTPTPCPAGFSVMKIWLTNEYDGYWQHIVDVPCSGADGTYSETVYTSGKQEEGGGVWTLGKIVDVRLVITEPTGQSVGAGAPNMADGSPLPAGRFVTLDQDRTIDFDIYPGGGFGVARWQLVSNNTKADLTSCAAAGVDKIRFTYFMGYYPGTTTPIVTEWPCGAEDIDFSPDTATYELGSGRTRAVEPGTYYGTFEALRSGVVVGTRGGDGDAIGFDSKTGNNSFGITNATITINDR